MANVLVDNATISSSLRALGYAPTAKKELLEVDQVALERLTEAILLAERVLIPDNYQEEFRNERKQILHHDCFQHVTVPENITSHLEIISTEMCKLWADAYKDGARNGSLARYFNLADSYFDSVWRGTKDSAYYVINGYLGIGKNNPLITAFVEKDYGDFAIELFGDFTPDLAWELDSYRGMSNRSPEWFVNDGQLSRKPVKREDPWRRLPDGESNDEEDYYDDREYETDIEPDVESSIADDLKRLISTLAWLGKQYIWHQSFSAQLGASYFPHPLRDFFAEDFLSELEQKPAGAKFGGVIRHGLQQFRKDSHRALEELGLGTSLTTISLPTFLPLAVRMSSSGQDFLDTLSQLRAELACVQLREMLSEVEEGLSRGDIKPYRKVHNEIEKIGKNLLRERGIESTQIKLSPPWKLIGVTPADVGVDTKDILSIGVEVPSLLYKQLFVARRYRVILKDIMKELAIIPTLGQYKDKLNSYAT